MRYVIAVSGALLIGGSAFLPSAQAQSICGERRALVATLEKTYSETPVSVGLASNGAIIEIFASPTGTFTIILTRPDGLTCVMASGESWQDLPNRLAGAHT